MKSLKIITILILLVGLSEALPTPTLLAQAGSHSATLSWQPSTSVCTAGMAYNVYRGNSAGGENYVNSLNTSPQTALSYVDSTVIPLTTYFYTVKAFCSSSNVKESLPSNEVQAIIPGDPQPNPPQNLTVISQ